MALAKPGGYLPPTMEVPSAPMRSLFPLVALAALGCDREPPPAPPAPAPTAVVSATTSASSTASADPPLPPITSAHPPAVGRWDAAAEAVVEGAPKGCDAQLLGPWLRVRCRGGDAIRVTRGGGDGKTYAITQPGEVALITRFVEGVAVEAEVDTSGGKQSLSVRWLRGEPRPAVVATFAPR